MVDIFISYSKADRAVAESLARDLEEAGYSVWWDTRLVGGDEFSEQIQQRIDEAKAAIIIWTPTSVRSRWVKAEAARADAQRNLIPVRLKEVPDADIPLPYGTLHTELASNRLALVAALAKLGAVPHASHQIPSSLARDIPDRKPATLGTARIPHYYVMLGLFIGIIIGTGLLARRSDLDMRILFESNFFGYSAPVPKSDNPDLIEAIGPRIIPSATVHSSRPDPGVPPVTQPRTAAFKLDGMPDHSASLQAEMARLEVRIRFAEDKINLGQQASKSWNEQATRVKNLIESHAKQASACELAKQDLKRRSENGTPEVFLSDGRRHIAECEEARRRYRGMIARIEISLAKMRIDIEHVLENVDQLRAMQIEQSERRQLLQELERATAKSLIN